jgi:mediator of RNA polymerase II transcription subunit 12
VDLTLDGTDAAQGRYGTMPRMGGSRLKLEISDTNNREFVESPKAATAVTPTWRPNVTPHARSQLHFEIPNVSNLSPRAAQEGPHGEAAVKPMPLPIRPGQHAPPSYRKARPVAASTAKKDVRPKPYTLEVPAAAPRYPSNGMFSILSYA